MSSSNTAYYGFFVEGHPQPKERPRFANGHAYTPTATRDYEKRIAQLWETLYPDTMLTGELVIHVDAFSKTADRADIDNYLKIALDGLQGYAFKNDSKVISIKATKRRVETPEEEGMRIAVFHMLTWRNGQHTE